MPASDLTIPRNHSLRKYGVASLAQSMWSMTPTECESVARALSNDNMAALESYNMRAPTKDELAMSLAAVSTETERLHNAQKDTKRKAFVESLVAALPSAVPTRAPDDTLGRAGLTGLPDEQQRGVNAILTSEV
jgi:hypothetical protein